MSLPARYERLIVWTLAIVGCLAFWALIAWLAYLLTGWAAGDIAAPLGYWGP